MPRYIVRRLLALIPVILGLTLVIFLLVNVIPGDTARLIDGEYADEATLEQIREIWDGPIRRIVLCWRKY